MRGTRRISAVVGVTASAFGLSLVVGYQAHPQAPNAPMTKVKAAVRPFTSAKEVLHATGTQREPLVRRETYARRSDGSYVSYYEVASPSGEIGWAGAIFDVRKGKAVDLEPFTKSAMTFYYSKEEMYEWLGTKESCASDGLASGGASRQNRPADVFQGREVVQVVQQVNGQRIEKWVDPELDCYPLHKSIVLPGGGSQDHTVTQLDEGEPPDSLFEVPSGYIEASPEQVEALYMAKYSGHRVSGEKLAKIVDDRYHNSRKK